jgi:glycosyltransferase involved in cell wall biosynthesis
MRVLLLNYEFPPLGGGAGRAMQSMAHQLAAMGHEIDIVTSHTKFTYKESVECGVKIFAVPSFRNGIHDCGIKGVFIYLFFAYFKILKLFRSNNYDIIHYFFSLPTAFISLLPGKHRKIPYVVSLRGSDVPNYDVYNKKLKILHSLTLPLTRVIWSRAKSVIAVTKSLEHIAAQTSPFQRIEVIPNGIDSTIFTRLSYPDKNDREFKLITVSRLIERKGIQHILKALAETGDKSIRLVIIGEGNYENELLKICKNLKLTDVVTFLGFRMRDTLPEYFSKSDVFILPSLAEAFGNVIAEAMACGLPIISTKEGGIVDLVEHENGILVEPGNISQIKAAIIKMKSDLEMRKCMSNANHLKMAENFNWEKITLSYIHLYERSINEYYK